MKLLVTGGLGFIGSNYIRHQLQADPTCSIINLDKQTYSGNPENLRDIESNPRYRWVKGDIVDAVVVSPLVREAEVIVHFAAESHVDRSILDPDAFLRTNVNGTHVLLEAAKQHGVKLFFHVSTDEVYGSVERGESVETDPLEPNSPYSASKAASDLLVRAYHVTHGLPTIITRCSNNFGPYQFPEKALPLLVTNALEDRPFPLYGAGENVRDWLYVLDHAKAISFLLQHGKPGEIYNIGGTFSSSNKDLFTHVLERMGKPESLLQQVVDRKGHDKRYALNCDKLKRLGWSPETGFAEALEKTIRWYEQQTAWWKPIKHGDDFQRYYQRQYASQSVKAS